KTWMPGIKARRREHDSILSHSGARRRREPGIQTQGSREHLDSGSGAHAPSRNDASLGRVAPTRPFLNGTLNRPAYRVRGPARDKWRMAAKKKPANTRREPSFDDDDDDSPELRVTGSDRASPTSDRAPSAKPRKRRARKKRPARGIGARIGPIAYWGLVASLWLGIACVGVIAWTGAHLPPIQSPGIPKRPPSIQIVHMQGRAPARRRRPPRAPLPLREMPGYVPKAFIAIEDRRFYGHYGVDPYGIGRAFVANVLHRSVAQGGSTITQQLAKNLFLTQERTINRKLQEGLLALWL